MGYVNALKRYGVHMLGRALNARIVRKGKVGLLFEEDHLQMFFAHFGVDCVFDVGANAGQYGLMLRRIGYNGSIISFEPVPELAEELRRLAAKDGNWHIEETALDSAVRRIDFHVMADTQFSSVHAPLNVEFFVTPPTRQIDRAGDAIKDMNKVLRQINISTATLDLFFRKYRDKLGFRHPYLKMDTQGNDLAVAQGAGDIITEFVGLQSELAIQKIYDSPTDYKSAIEYFSSKGFVLSAFVPNNPGHFPYLVEIDCIMFNSKFNH